MYTQKELVLARIGELFDAHGLLWGVGASTLLFQYGLVDAYRDIDLLVVEEQAALAEKLLDNLGTQIHRIANSGYDTRFFRQFEIDGVDVDLIAGFAIRRKDVVYRYYFSAYSIPRAHTFAVGGRMIPFTALEDWYVLYQLMEGREHRVAAIREHLRRDGIRHPALLERMIQSGLPVDVLNNVHRLMAEVKLG